MILKEHGRKKKTNKHKLFLKLEMWCCDFAGNELRNGKVCSGDQTEFSCHVLSCDDIMQKKLILKNSRGMRNWMVKMNLWKHHVPESGCVNSWKIENWKTKNLSLCELKARFDGQCTIWRNESFIFFFLSMAKGLKNLLDNNTRSDTFTKFTFCKIFSKNKIEVKIKIARLRRIHKIGHDLRI